MYLNNHNMWMIIGVDLKQIGVDMEFILLNSNNKYVFKQWGR